MPAEKQVRRLSFLQSTAVIVKIQRLRKIMAGKFLMMQYTALHAVILAARHGVLRSQTILQEVASRHTAVSVIIQRPQRVARASGIMKYQVLFVAMLAV